MRTAQCGNQSRKIKSGSHLDSSGAALAHSVGHGGAGRVNHGHETHEAKVVRLEVHVIRVEGKSFRIFILRQEEVAET